MARGRQISKAFMLVLRRGYWEEGGHPKWEPEPSSMLRGAWGTLG